MIADLHFLRPEWLWLLLPATLALLVNRRQHDLRRRWLRVIDVELLEVLLGRGDSTRKVRPITVLTVVIGLGILALAGPTWEREPSPFTEDTAALVIVLKLTDSMLTNDVQPSRLERARHKIRDLLEMRAGARTALVAYAGSAHLVMPLTRDADVIESFAAELSPELMPRAGENLSEALTLADRTLRESGQPGSILVITDGLNPSEAARIRTARPDRAVAPVLLGALAPAASVGEAAQLREAAGALGSVLEFITADDDDVRAISRQLANKLTSVDDPGTTERWRDAGYWLTPLLALLSLLWFRPGWSVSWDD